MAAKYIYRADQKKNVPKIYFRITKVERKF